MRDGRAGAFGSRTGMDGGGWGWVGGEGGSGRGGDRVVVVVEKGEGVVESGGVGLALCNDRCIGGG